MFFMAVMERSNEEDQSLRDGKNYRKSQDKNEAMNTYPPGAVEVHGLVRPMAMKPLSSLCREQFCDYSFTRGTFCVAMLMYSA